MKCNNKTIKQSVYFNVFLIRVVRQRKKSLFNLHFNDDYNVTDCVMFKFVLVCLFVFQNFNIIFLY